MNRWIPWISVTRPVTMVTAFMVVLVVGLIAWMRIPVQMMPSGFSPPFMWVWVPYEDATPTETEAAIVKPMEDQIATVPGLKRMRSNAEPDAASFSLEFHSSVDMDDAYNSVTDRIERAMPALPDDVKRAWIFRFDPSDEPIIWAGISAPAESPDLHYLVTRIVQKRLERIPGVGRVDIWGVDEPIVWIDFNREAIQAHHVDLLTLMGTLGSDNFQLASGRVTDRGQIRYVRQLARFETLEDIRRFPVADGVVLSDIADVQYRAASDSDISRIDGKEGGGMAINKESSANTIEVAEAVREAFAELEADPRLAGFHFPVFFDQGELIADSMHHLERTAIEGAVLAVIVLMLFLREWRITTLITATIPSTLLLTFTVMYFRGDSLNLLSMLGLMLAVGMVVDDAVVVVEAIYRRRQMGQEAHRAAIEGTAEVLLPVTASTLTAVVVFLPLILMSGDEGFSFFFGSLGLPVVFVRLGSLLITVFFTPLSTVWVRGDRMKPEARWVIWLTERVDRGVAWVLKHPSDTLVGVVGAGMLTIMLPVQGVGCTDNADGNINDFDIRFEVPAAYTYAERLDVVKAFEKVVEDHRDDWGVRVYRSRLGAEDSDGFLGVYLEEDPTGERTRAQVMKEAKEALPDLPGVRATIGWGDNASDNTKIAVQLKGEDTDTLVSLSEEAMRRIRAVPGVLGVRNGVSSGGKDELHLMLRRREAAERGVTGEAIGRLVSFAMRGYQLTPWFQGEKEVRVFARFAQKDRDSVDKLMDFDVATAAGPIALRGLVDPAPGKGWGSIHRENRQTSLTLDVDLGPDLKPEDAHLLVDNVLGGMQWPQGYGVDHGSFWQDEAESQAAQMMALLLSITFVFLIMGVLFESFLLPLTVITTIPMAIFGVYWGLWLFGSELDPMGVVGLVILVGIIVNNGIVMVDVITELRAKGVAMEEAARDAVRIRLRPILMTALTAAAGVAPMAFGTATFVGIPYAPLGQVLLSGMIVGTVLTLFFVPAFYVALDRLRASGARWFAYVMNRPALRGAK